MGECVPAVCVVLSKERTVAVTLQVFGNDNFSKHVRSC